VLISVLSDVSYLCSMSILSYLCSISFYSSPSLADSGTTFMPCTNTLQLGPWSLQPFVWIKVQELTRPEFKSAY